MRITREVELIERRCGECGRWYCYEEGHGWNCPSCSQKVINERNTTIDHLHRVIRGLQSALKQKRSR